MAETVDLVCPWCPRSRFTSWKHLGRHIAKKHDGMVLSSGDRLWRHPGGKYVGCWCGACCSTKDFGDHLRQEGGLEAHLLDLIFDLNPRPPF